MTRDAPLEAFSSQSDPPQRGRTAEWPPGEGMARRIRAFH